MDRSSHAPRTRGIHGERRFADVSPSQAADEELTWFFNEAESAVEQPSSYSAMLSGCAPTSLEEGERRAEALHAAGKIRARLEAIPVSDARLLQVLYTGGPRPEHDEARRACAIAVSAYERARGTGPSVVPAEEG